MLSVCWLAMNLLAAGIIPSVSMFVRTGSQLPKALGALEGEERVMLALVTSR
ncbi:hypothetical protein HY230_04110 [Candidatus Acetothermia bacterium]|nr:hypothetical protein [Candidatus Acetothermia bacterium]